MSAAAVRCVTEASEGAAGPERGRAARGAAGGSAEPEGSAPSGLGASLLRGGGDLEVLREPFRQEGRAAELPNVTGKNNNASSVCTLLFAEKPLRRITAVCSLSGPLVLP